MDLKKLESDLAFCRGVAGTIKVDTPMHWTSGAVPRGIDDIEAVLRDNPNQDKLSFSATEMRSVVAAWKAEAALGQKFREIVYTNCALPATIDQIALAAATEIMTVVSRQYPPGGPAQVKAGVQAAVAAAIARARPSALLAAAMAGARKWTLLLTSPDKGLVGEFGKSWPDEPGHDHVDVIALTDLGANPAPPSADEAMLRNIQNMVHDNELAVGDRLQRLTLIIDAILAGCRADEIPTYIIREPADPFELFKMEQMKDAAYLERNQVVAALATCFPSGKARTAIDGWSEDWHGCVYIDLPTGQASWHYHDSHAHLFANLPPYDKTWDGHTTEEKYQRLADLRKPGLSEKSASIGQAYGISPELVALIVRAAS